MKTSPDKDVAPWYVVYTHINKELQVVGLVERYQGSTVYLPEVYQRYRNQVQLRPLFPRYLFVKPSPEGDMLAHVNRTPGVVRVVAFADTPLPLDNEVVQAIREEVQRLNERGGLPSEHFEEGESVRLRSGPLAGMEAVFIKHLPARDRVLLLLRFLGHENRVEVDLNEIERNQRRRRTRGRGRKIHYKEKNHAQQADFNSKA